MFSLSAKPPRKRSETALVAEIRAALTALPYVLLARNNCGMLPGEGGRPVRFGLGEGSADLVGCVSLRMWGLKGCNPSPVAVYLAIEVKLPGKEPTKEQQAWLDLYHLRGAITGCAHSVAEAKEIVRSGVVRIAGYEP